MVLRQGLWRVGCRGDSFVVCVGCVVGVVFVVCVGRVGEGEGRRVFLERFKNRCTLKLKAAPVFETVPIK